MSSEPMGSEPMGSEPMNSGQRPAVVLTQPAPRVARIAARLRALGADVIERPAFVLDAAPFVSDVRAVRRRLSAYALAVFASPTAAEAFAGTAGLHDWPVGTPVAAIGRGTAEAIARAALPATVPVLLPESDGADARALLAHPVFPGLAGRRVLVVRGADTRTDWTRALATVGIEADELVAYARHEPPDDDRATASLAALASLVRARRPVVAVVTHADGAARLAADAGVLDGLDWLAGQPVLAVHPRLVDACRAVGLHRAALVPPGQHALEAALSSARVFDPASAAGSAAGS